MTDDNNNDNTPAPTPEQQFDAIIERALSAAAAVTCDVPEYVNGVGSWQADIDIAIDAARGDLEEEGDDWL